MFKLKKDGEKLSVEEYQDVLKRYFEDAVEATNLSMDDLENVLGVLEG